MAMELVSQFSFELRAKPNRTSLAPAPIPILMAPTAAPPHHTTTSDLLDFGDFDAAPAPPQWAAPAPPQVPGVRPSAVSSADVLKAPEPAFEVEFDEEKKRMRILLDPGEPTWLFAFLPP